MSKSSSSVRLRSRSYRRMGSWMFNESSGSKLCRLLDQPADLAFVLADQGVVVAVHLGIEFVFGRVEPHGESPKMDCTSSKANGVSAHSPSAS